MSEETATEAVAEKPKKKGPKVTKPKYENREKLSRKTLKKLGRQARAKRAKEEPESAKKRFETKSKNSSARKVAFRKRHAQKAS